MFRTLFGFFLLGFTLDVTAQTTVFVIDDASRIGECAQRQGVVKALREYGGDDIKSHTFYLEADAVDPEGHFVSGEKLNHFLKTLADQTQEACGKGKVILLSGHNYGAEIFGRLSKTPKVITVLTAHQMWDAWRDLRKDQVDVVCLPSHIRPVFSSENPPTVIKTVGVSHALTSASLEEAYHKACEDGLMPEGLKISKKPCFLVILGGDVQDDKGQWHPYIAQEAQHLAVLVQSQTSDTDNIIVVDGPRTGRHLEKAEGAPNGVTQAFLTALDGRGISHNDFLFKVPGKPSLFAALGLVNKRGGIILVPGESTSMISEVMDTRTAGVKVLLYQHNAMLSPHHDHVKTEAHFKDVDLFQSDGGEWVRENDAGSDAPQVRVSASSTIAGALLKEIS